jgi:hypothetical protein
VKQQGSVHVSTENSADEASRALETLSNLLFLTAQCAEDASKVRRYVSSSESCISTLAGFLKLRYERPAKASSSYEHRAFVHQ